MSQSMAGSDSDRRTEGLAERAVPSDDPIGGRIESLDLIRGVAILGIPLMNIMGQAGPEWSYYVPQWYGGAGLVDHVIYAVQSLFVESRFMTLFSMLFGVGLAIQTDRFAARGRPPRAMIRRRLAWLLVFGVIHGALIWFGDILTLYALAGMVVVRWVEWPVKRQVVVGIVLLVIGQLAMAAALAGALATGENIMGLPDLPYDEVALGALRDTWTGWDRLGANLRSYAQMLVAIPLTLFWHASGLMLLGVALYRRGFFTDPQAWKKVLPWSLVGLAVAGGILVFRYRVGVDTTAAYATMSLMMIPGLLMAPAYAAFLVRWVYRGTERTRTVPPAEGVAGTGVVANSDRTTGRLILALQHVGKTAFTLYIAQSVVFVGLFAVVVPRLWGAWGRGPLWALTAVFTVVQVVFAHWWQTHRGQGPLEKLWRRAAYGRRR